MFAALIAKAAGKIGMSLLASFLTEKVLAKLMFNLLRKFAAQTSNKVDDQLIKDVEAAYYG